MIERLVALLTGDSGPPDLDRPDEVQVAVAALLVEAACSDDHFSPAERDTIAGILAQCFGLTDEATARLIRLGQEAAADASQLFRFTHMVTEHMKPADRIVLIEMLWEVAYTNGRLDPEEDSLVRQVAGLIYVSDQDRGAARLRVMERLGIKA